MRGSAVASSCSNQISPRSYSSIRKKFLFPRRRGDCETDTLTASVFSGDLMGRCAPVLRRVVLAVYLNAVVHVTRLIFCPKQSISGYIETVSKGAPGRNNRLIILKIFFGPKRTPLTTPTHDSHSIFKNRRYWSNPSELSEQPCQMKPYPPCRYFYRWINTHKKGIYAAAPCISDYNFLPIL